MFKVIFYSLLLVLFISCDVLGEELEKASLKEKEIQTFENIPLLKGDVVVLWIDVDIEYKEQLPSYRLKYHIEENHETVFYEEFKFIAPVDLATNPIIRSSKNNDRTYETYDDEDNEVIKNYTNWAFEIEKHRFEVPEDGTYTFDFKLYEDQTEFMSDGIGVILRKL